jgi:hypothetical protein
MENTRSATSRPYDNNRLSYEETKRSQRISSRVLNLTETDPFERFKQFCKQLEYKYLFRWDTFQNCGMYECEVFYFLNNHPSSRTVLIKKARYFEVHDMKFIKRELAFIILTELGISPGNINDSVDPDSTETEDDENVSTTAPDNLVEPLTRMVASGFKLMDTIISSNLDLKSTSHIPLTKERSEDVALTTKGDVKKKPSWGDDTE